VTAVPLDRGTRDALVAHFLALSAADRRLRFGSSLAPVSIAAYVDRLDGTCDVVFAVGDTQPAPIGVAHLSFGPGFAELGLSVLPGARGRGVGGRLFAHAARHARDGAAARLYMHCLADNAPIMRIARRFGMDIVTTVGDADAHLVLPPVAPIRPSTAAHGERFALFDRALLAHDDRWRRDGALPRDASPIGPRPAGA
jgi:GNAT superfamily N-acetyltransferase